MRIPFPLVQREIVRPLRVVFEPVIVRSGRGITRCALLAISSFICSAAEIGDVNVIRVIGHDARGFEEPRNRRVRGGVAFGAFGENDNPRMFIRDEQSSVVIESQRERICEPALPPQS